MNVTAKTGLFNTYWRPHIKNAFMHQNNLQQEINNIKKNTLIEPYVNSIIRRNANIFNIFSDDYNLNQDLLSFDARILYIFMGYVGNPDIKLPNTVDKLKGDMIQYLSNIINSYNGTNRVTKGSQIEAVMNMIINNNQPTKNKFNSIVQLFNQAIRISEGHQVAPVLPQAVQVLPQAFQAAPVQPPAQQPPPEQPPAQPQPNEAARISAITKELFMPTLISKAKDKMGKPNIVKYSPISIKNSTKSTDELNNIFNTQWKPLIDAVYSDNPNITFIIDKIKYLREHSFASTYLSELGIAHNVFLPAFILKQSSIVEDIKKMFGQIENKVKEIKAPRRGGAKTRRKRRQQHRKTYRRRK